MKFINKILNTNKMVDGVFKIANAAKNDTNTSKINATIGSLCDENNLLVSFNSFYDHYIKLDYTNYTKYSEAIKGNKDYIDCVLNHVLEDKVDLNKSCIATSGGTGAVSMTIKNTLDEGDTLLIPNVAWGSYKLMASEYGLNVMEYNIYDLNDMLDKLDKLAKVQSKVLVIINSPCHNPCGLSYNLDDFNQIINHCNKLEKPCIILNDIAYIDYSFNLDDSRSYMSSFNNINDNVLIVIAFSISKTMTAYGLRCGAAIILSKDKNDNEEVFNVFEKTARATWSNINNSAMTNFAYILNNHKDEFLKEKDNYIKLLKRRATIFMEEANEVKLDYYPYQEGFFITLKFDDNKYRDFIHEKLIDNHIYTVKVNHGIRIAICSINTNDIKGLASRIKNIITN